MSEQYDLLDPEVPLLLLPLRLETRSEQVDGAWTLRVRVYPDDVSLRRLARGLSAEEAEAARAWWRESWWPAADPVDPWPVLVAAVGPGRAPWVAEAMRPTNPGERGAADPVFPDPPPPEAVSAPRTALLPDALRVVVTQSGRTTSALGEPLPVDGVPTGSPDGDLAALGRSLTAITSDVADPTDPLAWITDFAAAERVGLGIRVTLPDGAAPVQKVTVVGVRTAGGPEAAAQELEELLTAHRYADGAALPPVGTVTNNTPDTRAAWSRVASRPGPPPLDPPPASTAGSAAADLVTALGLSPRACTGWDGGDDRGGEAAQAMTLALWPVSWGGFLDRVLARPLPGRTKEAVRSHLRLVRGRGPLPPVRLGRQPYGVLPVTSLSAYVDPEPTAAGIADVLRRVGPLWHAAAADLPHVSEGNLDRVLPEILGQGPVSRSMRVRRAIDLGGSLAQVAERVDPAALAGRTALLRVAEHVLGLGAGTFGDPTALGAERLLGLALADDRDPEVLERLLRPEGHGADYASVLQVLLALSEGQTRAALERLLERERWQIMRSRLLDLAGQVDDEQVELGSTALEVLGNGGFDEVDLLRKAAAAFESADAPWSADRFLLRFPVLALRPHPVDVAQGQDAPAVLQAVAVTLRAALAYVDVRESIRQLGELGSTAERARLLAETLDCASHRYDAWVTSLATRRLAALRADRPQGLAVGAYGVLEDLAIVGSTPVEDPPPGVDAGVLRPPGSGGAVLAPSISHAATAAVLRGARLTHDPTDSADGALEIDLTSTRVRAAMSVLAGVRAGQPLGALLGYRFERDLHEATPEHRLNTYVPSLRTLAPLVAAKSTDRVAAGAAPAALEAVAAGDVVDGVRLREIYLAERDAAGNLPAGSSLRTRLALAPPGSERYAAGTWSPPDPVELGLIVTALQRLDGLLDAVSDLLLAEGVHQLVAGNPARSAAAMDAIAGDAVPAEPDVLTPPATGTAYTHRLLVLARARSSSPPVGWARSPRAAADPSLEAWARDVLPPASTVVLAADPAGAPVALLSAAGLSALDLVSATGSSPALLWARLRRTVPDLPDAPLTTRPEGLPGDLHTLGEVWVLAGSVRALLAGGRSALPADLAPPGTTVGLRQVDLTDLRRRAGAARDALAATPDQAAGRVRRLRLADRLAAFGVGGGVDAGSLDGADLGPHVIALLAERDRRVSSADAALAGFDSAPPAAADEAYAVLSGVVSTVFGDRLPVLPVLSAPGPGDPFRSAQRRTGPATPDGAAIRPWLATAARVRPAAARLVETLMLREAVRGPVRMKVVQMPATGPVRWVGLPFDGLAPLDAVTACVVDAPPALGTGGRCVGLVVDGWTETVPRRRELADGPADLVTAGMAVHANGPDARAPQALLLAVSPDRGPWTWQRVADIVEETVALARTRLVTLERAPLGGALLPAVWAQDWSLQGEPVIDPRLLSEFADLRSAMTYVRESGG